MRRRILTYNLFEASGTIPKLSDSDIDDISKRAGKNVNPAKKEQLGNAVSNWFYNMSGDLLKNPDTWRDNYKKDLPGYDVKTATGKNIHVTTDAGFSDLVAGAVSLGKGITNKVFGGPKKVAEPEERINVKHQRLFTDTSDGEISQINNKGDFNKWVSNQYSKRSTKPGSDPELDKDIQASYVKWLGSKGGSSEIETAVKTMGSDGTTSTLGELGTAAEEVELFL